MHWEWTRCKAGEGLAMANVFQTQQKCCKLIFAISIFGYIQQMLDHDLPKRCLECRGVGIITKAPPPSANYREMVLKGILIHPVGKYELKPILCIKSLT